VGHCVPACDEDIYFETCDFGCKLIEAVKVSFRVSPLNGDVLSFHIAKLAETLSESIWARCVWRAAAYQQETDPWDLRGLLCVGERNGS